MDNAYQPMRNLENPSSSGRFVKGKLNGFGTIMYTNKDEYEGMFQGGRISGFGKMVYRNLMNAYGEKDMALYERQWKSHTRHG